VDEGSALHVTKLPDLHCDPFDRLLVAQALAGGLVLLTPDQDVRQYPVRALWSPMTKRFCPADRAELHDGRRSQAPPRPALTGVVVQRNIGVEEAE
jgi:hypothetical protein